MHGENLKSPAMYHMSVNGNYVYIYISIMQQTIHIQY